MTILTGIIPNAPREEIIDRYEQCGSYFNSPAENDPQNPKTQDGKYKPISSAEDSVEDVLVDLGDEISDAQEVDALQLCHVEEQAGSQGGEQKGVGDRGTE